MTHILAELSLPPICCLALFGGQMLNLLHHGIMAPLHRVKPPAAHVSTPPQICWRISQRVRALRQRARLDHDDSRV
jgi:hypothetical protein